MNTIDKSSQNEDAGNVASNYLSFEQILREEFLVNTQNYPKEYHELFRKKFERAKRIFEEQFGNK